MPAAGPYSCMLVRQHVALLRPLLLIATVALTPAQFFLPALALANSGNDSWGDALIANWAGSLVLDWQQAPGIENFK